MRMEQMGLGNLGCEDDSNGIKMNLFMIVGKLNSISHTTTDLGPDIDEPAHRPCCEKSHLQGFRSSKTQTSVAVFSYRD